MENLPFFTPIPQYISSTNLRLDSVHSLWLFFKKSSKVQAYFTVESILVLRKSALIQDWYSIKLAHENVLNLSCFYRVI